MGERGVEEEEEGEAGVEGFCFFVGACVGVVGVFCFVFFFDFV